MSDCKPISAGYLNYGLYLDCCDEDFCNSSKILTRSFVLTFFAILISLKLVLN
jgi:hypothetical protein